MLYPNDSVSDSSFVFEIKNSSASRYAGITNLGKGFFGTSTNGNANLKIGGGNTSYASLQIDHSSSMISSPSQGMIEQQSGILYFTDSTPTRRKVEVSLASSTAYQYRFSDVNGNMTANSNLTTNSGNTILISNILFQAKNGISLDSGKDLGMNGTGSIT
jgi:hypothetical protein